VFEKEETYLCGKETAAKKSEQHANPQKGGKELKRKKAAGKKKGGRFSRTIGKDDARQNKRSERPRYHE